jgi:glycosyltransferase involved in cell wall biosynthesis
MIAERLAERGFDVSFLCRTTTDEIDDSRFAFYTGRFNPTGPFPVKALLVLYSLFVGIHRANADVYYVRGRPGLSALSMLCCTVLGRKVVYAVANDSNIERERLQQMYGHIFYYLFIAILRFLPAKIAVQTEYQRDELTNKHGISTVQIQNGYTLPEQSTLRNHAERDSVLWIGRISENQKKPARFLKLAEELSDIQFVMVGPPEGDGEYYEEIAARASEIENLRFEGFVQPDEIYQYYNNAAIFVNTSDYEGFPNTFLEAWGYAVPVVSLYFSLDRTLEFEPVGEVAGSMSNLIKIINSLHNNSGRQRVYGLNGRDLVANRYSIEAVVDKYASVFKNASSGSG